MLLGPQSCLSLLEREISTLSQKGRGRECERAGLTPLPPGQQPHLQVQHLLMKARTKKWMFISYRTGVKAPLKQIGKTEDLGCYALCLQFARSYSYLSHSVDASSLIHFRMTLWIISKNPHINSHQIIRVRLLHPIRNVVLNHVVSMYINCMLWEPWFILM